MARGSHATSASYASSSGRRNSPSAPGVRSNWSASAVHAVRQLADPTASFADSALLALAHSLPQRATGEKVPAHKLLPVHREAWKAAETGPSSPMAALLAEPDVIRRARRPRAYQSSRSRSFPG